MPHHTTLFAHIQIRVEEYEKLKTRSRWVREDKVESLLFQEHDDVLEVKKPQLNLVNFKLSYYLWLFFIHRLQLSWAMHSSLCWLKLKQITQTWSCNSLLVANFFQSRETCGSSREMKNESQQGKWPTETVDLLSYLEMMFTVSYVKWWKMGNELCM